MSYFVAAEKGYAKAVMLPRPPCERCKGTGQVEVEQAQQVAYPIGPSDPGALQKQTPVRIERIKVVLRCRCMMLPDRIHTFNRAQIPARHAECSFENFRPVEGAAMAASVAKKWSETFSLQDQTQKGILWMGAPGRGKTHLMVATLRELVFAHGVACRFVEFTHLAAAIKESFGGGPSVSIDPLVEIPILAIDELGKGRKSDFELGLIDEILTRRYSARRRTLATTNYGRRADSTMESLEQRLGERLYSRLVETTHFFDVVGEDFRRTGKR